MLECLLVLVLLRLLLVVAFAKGNGSSHDSDVNCIFVLRILFCEMPVDYFFAGALAGLCGDALVHPLDTIRARMQIASAAVVSPLSSSSPSPTAGASSIVGSLRSLGVRQLYRGFGVVAVGTVPGHALYFAGYEYSKRFLASTGGVFSERPWLVHLTAGLLADVGGALVWTPMEVIKQRMQTQTTSPSVAVDGKQKSWTSYLRQIVRTDGPVGLYRGFGLALMTYGPYVSIYFALYEEWKFVFPSTSNPGKRGRQSLTGIAENDEVLLVDRVLGSPFLGAAVASSISATLTCPLDVVKTRVQVYQGPRIEHMYKHVFLRLWHTEGIRGFFRGLRPRVLWMAGGTSSTMAFYETFLEYLS